MMRIITITIVTIPTIPSTMPAIAIPSPLWPLCLICFRATNPKIKAKMEPTQYTQTMPKTIEAIASPFTVLTGVAVA
jgi:hypothetical protein